MKCRLVSSPRWGDVFSVITGRANGARTLVRRKVGWRRGLDISQPGAARTNRKKTLNLEPRTLNFEQIPCSRTLVLFKVQGSRFQVQGSGTECCRPAWRLKIVAKLINF